MRNKVEVTIAGRKLKIACPKGQESALFAAATELNNRLESIAESGAVNSPDQAMMMVALNLANDLLANKAQQEQERIDTQSKIELLQHTIEQALTPQIDKSA
ncbi:cell division protein ZapA [Thalassotalea euphylliae]|uniref:cell division protein ZapA n=1 Tax=Thalassotalea euphylliae TaxID=1655234 RepID=UPI00363AE376